MVRRKLESITSTESGWAISLWKEIQSLTVKSLRKIKSPEAISMICHEVISAVCSLIIVHIDEWVLAMRKPKKDQYIPIQHIDDSRWEDSSIIRQDWNSQKWLKKPPHGWVYYDTDWALLGTIYETTKDKWYEVFIKREVADNPSGARLLIWEMKNKLGKLIKKI